MEIDLTDELAGWTRDELVEEIRSLRRQLAAVHAMTDPILTGDAAVPELQVG